jgi:hypothetical protein
MECSREHHRPVEPIVESTLRTIVRDFLLEGLRQSKSITSGSDAELRANDASCAICGTILEWSRTRATAAEELASAVLPLVSAGLLLPEHAREAGRSRAKRGYLIRNSTKASTIYSLRSYSDSP